MPQSAFRRSSVFRLFHTFHGTEQGRWFWPIDTVVPRPLQEKPVECFLPAQRSGWRRCGCDYACLSRWFLLYLCRFSVHYEPFGYPRVINAICPCAVQISSSVMASDLLETPSGITVTGGAIPGSASSRSSWARLACKLQEAYEQGRAGSPSRRLIFSGIHPSRESAPVRPMSRGSVQGSRWTQRPQSFRHSFSPGGPCLRRHPSWRWGWCLLYLSYP